MVKKGADPGHAGQRFTAFGRVSSRHGACAFVVALWIMLISVAAAAQSVPSTAEEASDAAQTLLDASKLTEATDAFEAAYRKFRQTRFLYNAAASAEKAQDLKRAASLYSEFLDQEPNDLDVAFIRARIDLLKSAQGVSPAQPAAPSRIRSLLKVDSEPAGAPVSVYERVDPAAASFSGTQPPPGWTKVGDKPFSTPYTFSLRVGHYRVVIEPEKDYHTSTTEIDIKPVYGHELKANLSRGTFLGLLRVSSNVEGARIFLNEEPSPTAAVWGRTPKGEFIDSGRHRVWVEAPGYETYQAEVDVGHGTLVPVRANLERLQYGYARFDSQIGRFDINIDNGPAGSYDWQKGPFKLKLPAGLHRVELRTDGKRDYRGFVDVPRGQLLDVHVRFEDKFSYAAPIALTVLAAGAFVGTGVCGARLQAAQEDLADETAKPEAGRDGERLEQLKGETSLFQSLTIVGGIAGGVFAATSVLFYIDFGADSTISVDKPKEFDAEDPKKSAVNARLMPVVGPDHAGVVFRAAF